MADNAENQDTDDVDTLSASLTPLSRDDKLLDLIALLLLLAVMTGVYLVTGPEVFAAVTGVSGGLFTTWRGRGRPSPD